MDAFEQLVSEILWMEGYWVRTSVKVELTKKEKTTIGGFQSSRSGSGNLWRRPKRQAKLQKQARRLSLGFLLILLTLSSAFGTSVVAQLGARRIILAADTREDRLESGQANNVHHFHNDSCKIALLGSAAIAVSGNKDYQRTVSTDPIPDWDALSVAKAASTSKGHDLHEMAEEWARRSVSHYQLFYAVAPQRVKQLANLNSAHVLVDAFVVGWQAPIPLLYWEKVYLDEGDSAIKVSEQQLPYRELPYTTNAVTQELIEGNSQRMAVAKAKWKELAPKYGETDRDWRRAEFFINSTSGYDESVGPKVNIVQIPMTGRAEWIQNLTCHE